MFCVWVPTLQKNENRQIPSSIFSPLRVDHHIAPYIKCTYDTLAHDRIMIMLSLTPKTT
jgi:hypothetical protein